MPQPGPSIADWLEAVGTASATLLAAGALLVQQFDRRRLVARQVNGWAKIDTGAVTHVVLANASNVPVYDVIARLIFNGRTIAVVSPDCLPPGSVQEEDIPPEYIWACVADLDMTEQGPKVGLVFREPSNRVWRKTSRGRLKVQRGRYHWNEEHQAAHLELPPPLDANGADLDPPPWIRQLPRD